MVHSNPSWLVWGRSSMYDYGVCFSDQTVHKKGMQSREKGAKSLLSWYIYTVVPRSRAELQIIPSKIQLEFDFLIDTLACYLYFRVKLFLVQFIALQHYDNCDIYVPKCWLELSFKSRAILFWNCKLHNLPKKWGLNWIYLLFEKYWALKGY